MDYIKNVLTIRQKNLYAFVLSILVFLSFRPWPVWGHEWFWKVIIIVTFLISLNLLTKNNLRQNLFLANLYLISVLYLSFGGVKGYILPNFTQLSIYIFLLSLSKDFLVLVLQKFEKLITIVLLLGIITFLISSIVKLPSFSIAPLNPSKLSYYNVYIFDLSVFDYNIGNSRRFMSVFDEPGVIGSFLSLLISYKEIKFNKIRDFVFVVAGLLSFSLVFYIILFINLLYNKTLNIKFYLFFVCFIAIFYYVKPNYVQTVLFERFIVGNDLGIVNNRTTEDFDIKYDNFVKKGGEQLFLGLGPNSLKELSKEIELNVSSYKSVVYQYGILGFLIFVFFFFYSTWRYAPTKRGWFFFLIFLMVIWQRPEHFAYFNIIIYLCGLSYISKMEKINNKVLKQLR